MSIRPGEGLTLTAGISDRQLHNPINVEARKRIERVVEIERIGPLIALRQAARLWGNPARHICNVSDPLGQNLTLGSLLEIGPDLIIHSLRLLITDLNEDGRSRTRWRVGFRKGRELRIEK